MRDITPLAFIFSLTVCLHATTYTVQTLSYPGATQTYAQSINSSGTVAGYYTDDTGTTNGFIWNAGTFTPVTIPNVTDTWVTGINDFGSFCGYLHEASGATIGFVVSGETFSQFSATSKSRATFPSGINNSNVVAGNSETGTLAQPVYGGFVLPTIGGKSKALDVSGQANTWAQGVNSSADVVGFAGANLDPTTPVEGFIFNDVKGTTTIVNMPDMVQTRLYNINGLGVIVGYALDSSEAVHSFVYDAGTFQTFSIPGYTIAIPTGITNEGVVSGWAVTATNSVVGFVATP